MSRNHAHGRPAGRAPRNPRSLPPWLDERNRERARLRAYQQHPNRERIDQLLGGGPPQSPDGYALIDQAQHVVSRHDCISDAASHWVDGTFLRAVCADGSLRLLSVGEKAEAVRVQEAA